MKCYLKAGWIVIFLTINLAHAIPNPPADGETPASLSCIYGLTPNVPGCPIRGTSIVPASGSGVIAVIEGADNANALQELAQFSSQFNLNPLPSCDTSGPPCFQTYYAASCLPASNPNAGTAPKISNDLEPEIDIEWSHAMAPYASIYMIEANSWGIDDMMQGVDCANSLLTNGGIVSFSESFTEFPGETAYDSHFKTPRIIYIASSGDYSAPARYPSASPYVISAGGTMIERDQAGNFLRQVAWKNTGIPCTQPPCKTGGSGGPSLYESRPSYQNSVQKMVGNKRGTPDISFAAQQIDIFCCRLEDGSKNNQCPTSGTSCPTDGVWVKSGGTSLASPALAGIINVANSGATSTAQELSTIYTGAIKNYSRYWTDIIFGNNGYPALRGYDFTTGLGVPRGYEGK